MTDPPLRQGVSITRSIYTTGEGTLLGEATTENPVKSRSVAVSGDGSLVVAVDSSNVYGFSRDQFTVPANQSAATQVSAEGGENTTVQPVPGEYNIRRDTYHRGVYQRFPGMNPAPPPHRPRNRDFHGYLSLPLLRSWFLQKNDENDKTFFAPR